MSQQKKRRLHHSPSSHHQASSVMEVDTGKVVQFINNTTDGHVPLSVLFNPPLNFPSMEHIRSFILRNQDNFTTDDIEGPISDADRIWVKTALKLCDPHCRKDLTCDGTCGCLHLCRTFLLRGSKLCPFSNKKNRPCMFGHNFYNKHNKSLLQAHYLDFLSEKELRILFRRRICRSMATMPQVCLYYNGRGGKICSNKNCRSLHYCIDHLQGMCTGRCTKSHTMDTLQNRTVLELFAIDRSWTDEDLRTDLQQVMEHRRVSGNSYLYPGSQSDSDAAATDVSEDIDGSESEGPCCAECRENKAVVQDLTTRVECLENDLWEIKNTHVPSTSRGHRRKRRL